VDRLTRGKAPRTWGFSALVALGSKLFRTDHCPTDAVTSVADLDWRDDARSNGLTAAFRFGGLAARRGDGRDLADLRRSVAEGLPDIVPVVGPAWGAMVGSSWTGATVGVTVWGHHLRREQVAAAVVARRRRLELLLAAAVVGRGVPMTRYLLFWSRHDL
jgi:hypothetical protein